MNTYNVLACALLAGLAAQRCVAAAAEATSPDGPEPAAATPTTAPHIQITVTELGDRPPRERRRGDAQGCCKPGIRRDDVQYVGQGVLRLKAKIQSRYTHILILLDYDKNEIMRETVTFLTDRVIIEVSNLSCGDAPHYVRLWCPTHRSCYATKKALGECS